MGPSRDPPQPKGGGKGICYDPGKWYLQSVKISGKVCVGGVTMIGGWGGELERGRTSRENRQMANQKLKTTEEQEKRTGC